tara:strand:- start:296 stop:463 length:168 start_codon:yes stop_codon:yes gene_type:complete
MRKKEFWSKYSETVYFNPDMIFAEAEGFGDIDKPNYDNYNDINEKYEFFPIICHS